MGQTRARYVIKIEMNDHNANVMEWNIWRAVAETEFRRWFAPCREISAHGRLLVQKKVKVANDRSKYPEKVPEFFVDMKYQNWGLLNGKHVCCDYAGANLITTGLTNRMKPAQWWEHPL